MKDEGLDDTSVIVVYIFYNLVYSLAAYPTGRLSDVIGFVKIFIIGLFLFALVYIGMVFANQLSLFFIIFFLYGLYAAATERVAKAWISNITSSKDPATGVSTYSGIQSVCTMLASALAGWIWFTFGAGVAFFFRYN